MNVAWTVGSRQVDGWLVGGCPGNASFLGGNVVVGLVAYCKMVGGTVSRRVAIILPRAVRSLIGPLA